MATSNTRIPKSRAKSAAVPSVDPVDAYCIRIAGDSLRPRIKSGDFIALSPNYPYQAGDEVMVETKDRKTMIREFLYRRDGSVAFLDVNGSGERTTLKESDISKIHFIFAITKGQLYRAGLEAAVAAGTK